MLTVCSYHKVLSKNEIYKMNIWDFFIGVGSSDVIV